MFLIETWAPTRELIDNSSISSCHLEHLLMRFGALVIKKQDLLLIGHVFVLLRADICDQQISGTWVFLLLFLLLPLKYMQDLFSLLSSQVGSPAVELTDPRCSQNGQRQEFIGERIFGPWKNLSDIFLSYPTIINQLKLNLPPWCANHIYKIWSLPSVEIKAFWLQECRDLGDTRRHFLQ